MSEYGLESPFVRSLDEEIMAVIRAGVDQRDEALFDDLALREFRVQYHANPVYRAFCQERSVSPETVSAWPEIPPLPMRYFKEQVVSSVPLDQAELQYMSSGTTNPETRTRVYRDERCREMVYEANRVSTRAYLFPEVDRMPILLFVPSPELVPMMGMAVGLTVMRDAFGTPDSCYLIGPEGLDFRTLYRRLFAAEETGQPIALIGATSGFVYLFNQLAQQKLRFKLPAGSRIADGGGYMGTFGDCSREEYLAQCEEYLGVPPEYCVNTLGMAECGQNYCDNVLRAKVAGRPAVVRYKPALPWTRVMVVDPATGRRLPKGEPGLICHYDLTNRAGVVAVLTDNAGYEVEDGFEILGRAATVLATCSQTADRLLAEGHSAHPCSTAADQLLAGAQSAHPCSTVADRLLAAGAHSAHPCSTAADQLLGNTCQAVAERMLAAGAPSFVVEMVKRKLAAGEQVRHPFPMKPGQQDPAAGGR